MRRGQSEVVYSVSMRIVDAFEIPTDIEIKTRNQNHRSRIVRAAVNRLNAYTTKRCRIHLNLIKSQCKLFIVENIY